MLSAIQKRTLAMVFCLIMIGACAPTHFNIKAKARGGSIPKFAVNGAVNVETYQASRSRIFEVEEISVDYQQIAQTSVTMIEAALRENSFSSNSGEPKNLVYAITSIDCMSFGACFINFVVKTGDGDIRGFMTEGTGFLLTGALKEAVEKTALAVFSDRTILEYVAR